MPVLPLSFLLACIPCHYRGRWWSTHKTDPRPKLWMWHSYWETFTLRLCRKKWNCASSLLWTPRWRTGDLESSNLPLGYWMHALWIKTRHCVREAQLWSNVESCFWLFAEAFRKWELFVLLCTWKQHFDGAMNICGDQKRFVKNQECFKYLWCHRSVDKWTNNYKKEVLKAFKLFLLFPEKFSWV